MSLLYPDFQSSVHFYFAVYENITVGLSVSTAGVPEVIVCHFEYLIKLVAVELAIRSAFENKFIFNNKI